ncbi:glycosyltransferase family 4 protein [Ancylobacter sp. IITR112]|uniref:glycosyltransferase family 4 protein n=1 Tax=Ancylobacter sp. IITR112 TaxID=3138073 RepID=UPI00352AA14D
MSAAASAGGAARPRLILLSQWFDPEPTVRGLAFARRLDALGFDVEVVTGFPNYPGGKVYEGYRIRPLRREVVDGIRITRLALYPSHDRSRIGRVLNYVSFFFSATFYLLFLARRADVIHAYHPPLTVALAGVAARLLRRMPLVLDVQDMWPDTLRATGMLNNERALRLIGAVCRWTWRRADRISVLSEGFQRLLVERGVPPERITVISNWADEAGTDGAAVPLPAFAAPGRFRVLFAGNMGPAQALDTVIDAAALLTGTHPQIEFCFLGGGLEATRLQQAAAMRGLANVRFFPRVPQAEVGPWLAAADALLVHLRDDPLFAITVPSKTQAYLAAGKPILMAVAGDAAELVRRAGAGLAVPPENAAALAAAVTEMAGMEPGRLAALGANGRRYYDEHLSFARGTQRMAAVLRQAMAGNGRA